MDSNRNKEGLGSKAWNAFQECCATLEEDWLAVELRPRFRDQDTAFSGDYDFLMDSSRFEEIVQLFFRVCLKHEVSFHLRQRATFKQKIVLFGSGEQRIVFEFWPHAELTKENHQKGWSFLTYQHFTEACDAGFREETLALIFVCHLFFKQKDLSNTQNQWRLEEFFQRMDSVVAKGGHQAVFAGKVRELLSGIIKKQFSLAQANRLALNLLEAQKIEVESCGQAARKRSLVKAGRFFSGWGGRVVPCVGPDGSGKTYFISEVMKRVESKSINASSFRFKNLFRKNRIYSFINKRYRTRCDLPKNSADERLAGLLYWFALPAYMWAIIKTLSKSAVFMDRFFLEFMVRGYREGRGEKIKPIRGYSLLCRLIPEPRKLIVLTADDELIASRKAELSSEAIQDFYSRYISYSVNQNISNTLFLNTHRTGEDLAMLCLDLLGLAGENDK